jgi:hypothetical protein
VKLKKDLKKAFPEGFSETQRRCSKMQTKSKRKEDSTQVSKRKRSATFASIEKMNKKSNRLMKTVFLTPINYSKWSAPTMDVKKKYQDIGVCADRSNGSKHTGSKPKEKNFFISGK